MNDDKLTRALHKLPRQRASSGFRADVLRRLDEPRAGNRSGGRALVWVLAASALLAFVLAFVQLGNLREERFADQKVDQRVQALRQEYRALERDLADLRRIAAEARPVLGVEADEGDYFVDLRTLVGEPALQPNVGTTRPASYQGRTDL